MLDRLLKEYQGRVKIVKYHVAFSDKSLKAAEAALCAGDQGRYWEYHDKLFERQKQWSNAADITSFLNKYALELGLNEKKFSSCLSSGKMAESLKKDDRVRVSRSITSTPTIFIGKKRLVGAKAYFIYKRVVDELLQNQ